MNLEVADALDKTNIPYKVDFEISKRLTKERGEVVVVIVKTKSEVVNKSEINKVLAVSFSNELYLSFHDNGNNRIVSVYIDEIGKIGFCSPSFKCEEFGVVVEIEK
ncbi:hypothetical protein D3C78_1337070 [compost metagenome]